MIIVSQDKEEIVNFNLICNMFVFGSGIRCVLADGSDTIIGEYETQERAKEVLEEIIEAYNKSKEDFYVQESETRWEKGEEYLVGYRNKNTNKTYYMPK